ncbi:hypothetical protein HII31_10440 [Pseudocercospora fuligena]|uniref:Fungal N-terminal domain-containing protein n=1 Tax=Pseudocercospora fuligena TaxID=685502 RepID=A0A8H6VEA7_9PEZI|nr:hypothetical protein HII31_10440 [Pseudocercospora fuligena]
MAEAIGLTVGLASLAIQLGDSVAKLKGFCRQYAEAPNMLQKIAFSLETTGLILREMDRERQDRVHSSPEMLTRCVKMCKEAIGLVKTTTDKLEQSLLKSHIRGRLRIAFRAEEVAQLCNELNRAEITLGNAYLLYTRSRQEQATEEILRQLEVGRREQEVALVACSRTIERSFEMLKDRHAQASADQMHFVQQLTDTLSDLSSMAISAQRRNSDGQRSRRRRRLFSAQHGYALTMKFPAWLVSRVWQVSIRKSYAGFDFRLRTCNVVPRNSPIFTFCGLGSLPHMRTLIADGKASPLDQDPQGFTLLQEAINAGHEDLVEYLLPFCDTNDLKSLPSDDVTTPLYRNVFVPAVVDDSDLNLDLSADSWGSSGLLWACCPDLASQRAFQRAIVNYDRLPLQIRFRNAMSVSTNRTPRRFFEALGSASSATLAHLRDHSGRTALHYVAAALTEEDSPTIHWKKMVSDLISAGADLSAQDQDGESPLMTLLTWLSLETGAQKLLDWVTLLQELGVDIEEYGNKERRVFETLQERLMVIHKDLVAPTSLRLIVGPRPEDWDMLGRVKIATSVWEAQQIPGSWPAGDRQIIKLPWQPTNADHVLLADRLPTPGVWSKQMLILPTRSVAGTQKNVDDMFGTFDRIKLLETCQDDSTLLVFSESVVRDQSQMRKRSRSQPPDVWTDRDHRQDVAPCRRWVGHGAYHRCRYDSKWKPRGDQSLYPNEIWEQQRLCATGTCATRFSSLRSDILAVLQVEHRLFRGHKQDDIINDLFHQGEFAGSRVWKYRDVLSLHFSCMSSNL